MRFSQRAAALAACLSLSAVATAEDAGGPPIVPATRSEMKQVLEHSKQSQPRLPLPPPSADEQGEAARNGGWGLVNNARMRRLYLPPELDSGFTRVPDPAMTLDHAFKTMFFWIVSRANNCTYCMGHQESKLSASGVEEDRIAALDGDWSEFDDAQRAAFAFTRKLTYQPHAIDDADLDRLRPYYKEDQILEIIVTVANNNAMNRWTGSLAIPQEEHRVYLTPTAAKYRALVSQVAPLSAARSAEAPARARHADRPPLESRAEVEKTLAACRTRAPRIPPLAEAEARAVLSDDATEGPLPQWVRLLTRFPVAGKARIVGLRNAETVGRLSPRLKAQIAWIAARHDRAWYALDVATRRLQELGLSIDDIFALSGPWTTASPAERAAFAFTRKLTVDPARIEDADVEELRHYYADAEVAELIHHVTLAAFFDRLTEACALPLDGDTDQETASQTR